MSAKEAMKQALEALEALQGGCTDSNDGTVEAITVWCPEVIENLEAALAESANSIKPVAESEPVAWMNPSGEGYDSAFRDHSTVIACTGNKWEGWIPLYTHPAELRRLHAIEDEWARLSQDDGKAEREIDRLRTVNQELLEALKTITSMCESVGDFSNGVTDSTRTIDEGAILALGVIQDARAAIARAEGARAAIAKAEGQA